MLQALRAVAKFSGKKFLMQINSLREYDCSVTGAMGQIAWIGAAVGILHRASLGPAHG